METKEVFTKDVDEKWNYVDNDQDVLLAMNVDGNIRFVMANVECVMATYCPTHGPSFPNHVRCGGKLERDVPINFPPPKRVALFLSWYEDGDLNGDD